MGNRGSQTGKKLKWHGLVEWHLLVVFFPQGRRVGWGGSAIRYWGTLAAAGTGVLMALAAERTGEPVRGPRAVDAGRAEMPVIMPAVPTAVLPLGRLVEPAMRDWSFTIG